MFQGFGLRLGPGIRKSVHLIVGGIYIHTFINKTDMFKHPTTSRRCPSEIDPREGVEASMKPLRFRVEGSTRGLARRQALIQEVER